MCLAYSISHAMAKRTTSEALPPISCWSSCPSCPSPTCPNWSWAMNVAQECSQQSHLSQGTHCSCSWHWQLPASASYHPLRLGRRHDRGVGCQEAKSAIITAVSTTGRRRFRRICRGGGVICVDLWRVVKREKRGPSPKIPRIRVAQMAYWFTLFYGCI
jgi:hypothetical protein